jgi:molybdenum cofactor cytidylyltransferase
MSNGDFCRHFPDLNVGSSLRLEISALRRRDEIFNSRFPNIWILSTLWAAHMEPANDNREFCMGIVVLAAGRAGRMGRPKLLLPWGETSILGRQLHLWRQLSAVRQVAIVCAAGDEAMPAELDRLMVPAHDLIFNPLPEKGMFESIRCAARWAGWNATLTHWAISLGDQPQLRPETLRALMDASAAQPGKIHQPQYRGHARHPVWLPEKFFRRLPETGAGTLKEFLRARAGDVVAVEVDDPGLDIDIDTPADYQRALAAFLRKP